MSSSSILRLSMTINCLGVIYYCLCHFSKGLFAYSCHFFKGLFVLSCHFSKGLLRKNTLFSLEEQVFLGGEMLWVGNRAPLPLIPVRSVEVVVQWVGIFEYFAFAEESFHLDFGCLNRVRSVDDVLLTAH